MDYRNKVDDKKIIIYGHNSEVIDTDFKKLNKYTDKSFYEKHKIMKFMIVWDKGNMVKYIRLKIKNQKKIEQLKL